MIMRWWGGLLIAVLGATWAATIDGAAAWANDLKPIDCSETNLKFEAPGFEVKCRDASRGDIGVGEALVGAKVFTLHAWSDAEVTFLDVISDHLVGNTRVFYYRTGLKNDIDRYYTADFTDWKDDDDIGSYEVKQLTAKFKSDRAPLECIAFRMLGGRRFEGVSGMTVGLACSDLGREHAHAALKKFTGD
jgi:hypothetical protein